MAEDADVIAFGGVRLIRGMGGYGKSEDGTRRRDEKMMEYHIPSILNKRGLTPKQFVDVCILCKCDFTSKIQDIGYTKALRAICKHKSIEQFMLKEFLNPKGKKKGKVMLTPKQVKQENMAKIPPDFDPEGARKVFYEYLDTNTPYNYTRSVEVSPFDHKNLCNFLKSRLKQWQELAVGWTERITGMSPGYHSETQLFEPSCVLHKHTPRKLTDASFLLDCPFCGFL